MRFRPQAPPSFRRPPPTAPAAAELEPIIVVAHHLPAVTRAGLCHSQGSDGVEKTALVHFADLDLTRSSHVYTLETRVAEAAARVCKKVADQVPDGQPTTLICTRRAIEDAMTQVQLIARMANQL